MSLMTEDLYLLKNRTESGLGNCLFLKNKNSRMIWTLPFGNPNLQLFFALPFLKPPRVLGSGSSLYPDRKVSSQKVLMTSCTEETKIIYPFKIEERVSIRKDLLTDR